MRNLIAFTFFLAALPVWAINIRYNGPSTPCELQYGGGLLARSEQASGTNVLSQVNAGAWLGLPIDTLNAVDNPLFTRGNSILTLNAGQRTIRISSMTDGRSSHSTLPLDSILREGEVVNSADISEATGVVALNLNNRDIILWKPSISQVRRLTLGFLNDVEYSSEHGPFRKSLLFLGSTGKLIVEYEHQMNLVGIKAYDIDLRTPQFSGSLSVIAQLGRLLRSELREDNELTQILSGFKRSSSGLNFVQLGTGGLAVVNSSYFTLMIMGSDGRVVVQPFRYAPDFAGAGLWNRDEGYYRTPPAVFGDYIFFAFKSSDRGRPQSEVTRINMSTGHIDRFPVDIPQQRYFAGIEPGANRNEIVLAFGDQNATGGTVEHEIVNLETGRRSNLNLEHLRRYLRSTTALEGFSLISTPIVRTEDVIIYKVVNVGRPARNSFGDPDLGTGRMRFGLVFHSLVTNRVLGHITSVTDPILGIEPEILGLSESSGQIVSIVRSGSRLVLTTTTGDAIAIRIPTPQ